MTAPVNGKGRMRPFLRLTGGVVAALEWSGKIIVGVTLVTMFAALLANVILRYAFGSGISWAYEIHALLLPWLVAGGIVIAAAQGRNIAISLLPDLLSPEKRRIVMLAVHLIVLVIVISVLWSSQPILKASQFQRLSTLGIKQVWGYSSLIYAFACMGVISVLHSLHIWLGAGIGGSDPANASLS